MLDYKLIKKYQKINSHLIESLNPLIKQIDPSVKILYYVPSIYTDMIHNIVAVKKNGEYKFIDVKDLCDYQLVENIINVMSPDNIRYQYIKVKESANEKLNGLLLECEQQNITPIQYALCEETLNKTHILDDVLNHITLPARSKKSGWTDTAKLDAIEEYVSSNSKYKVIDKTEHYTLYGKKDLSPYNEKPILISSHSDIVSSITEVSSQKNNNYYHGTYDNLGTNAAAVTLMVSESFPDNVYFAFTDEEETGRCFGADKVSDYIKTETNENPFCIALDVTDEGFYNNRLITLEGLSGSDEEKKLITDAIMNTEGNSQSFDVVRNSLKENSYFNKDYLTSSTTVFDESIFYGKQKNLNALSFCLPTDGYMHSNLGLDVKEPVFIGYIYSIASFIYSYTNTNSKKIDLYKDIKDSLIDIAKSIPKPLKTYFSNVYVPHTLSNYTNRGADYEYDEYDDYDYDDDYDDDYDEEITESTFNSQIESELLEMISAYDVEEKETFLCDVSDMYGNFVNLEKASNLFDSQKQCELGTFADDESLQEYLESLYDYEAGL